MKFPVNKVLINHKGQPLLDGPSEAVSVPLTLGSLAVEALLRELPPDNNAPGKVKIQRWNLAKQIQKMAFQVGPRSNPGYHELEKQLYGRQDDFVLLSVDEVALIKTRIQQGFPAIVVGPAEVAIESNDPFQGDELARIGG